MEKDESDKENEKKDENMQKKDEKKQKQKNKVEDIMFKDIENKENGENSNKSESKFLSNINEIKCSDSSISEIIQSDFSTSKNLSLNEKNLKDNIINEKILPQLYSSNEEELFDGKDYESRVKSYLKIFFECSTEKDIKIESNPARNIYFVYDYYEKIIKADKDKKNEIINGATKKNTEAEFDFQIKNINKEIILNIKENFKGNIICSSNLDSLDEKKNYQIIGEVAKNILHQSSDKIKQINKYVDIILINDILKKLKNIENKEKIVKNFKTLNFNFNDDKIIMIVTDGSYVKLSKATNDKLDNKIFSNRDIKDAQNYRKIIQLLKDSKIPFIIFFIPNDLRNNIDDFLIEHAKKKNYKEIKTNLENNIYKSYSFRLIEQEIDKFKKDIFNIISSNCSIKDTNLEYISYNLYNEIIERINIKNIFNLELVILKKDGFIPKNIINFIFTRRITEDKSIKFQEVILDNDKCLEKYINDHKKIPNDTFRLLFYKSKLNKDIKFFCEKSDAFSFIIEEENITEKVYELENNFYLKFKNYISQQIKKKIYKYCIYYSNNQEYLNGKNLINKIIYDLRKLNINIDVKNNEKSFIESDGYKALCSIIKNIDLTEKIYLYYIYDFCEWTRDILNLKEEHFKNLNDNKFKVFEEFYCWRLYELFFNILIEKIVYK